MATPPFGGSQARGVGGAGRCITSAALCNMWSACSLPAALALRVRGMLPLF